MASVVYFGPHDSVECRIPGEAVGVEVAREGVFECDDDTAANLVAGGDWRYQDGEEPNEIEDAVDETADDEDDA